MPAGAALQILQATARGRQPSAIVPTEFPAIEPVGAGDAEAGSAMTPPIAIRHAVGPAPDSLTAATRVPVYYRYQGPDPPVHYASYTPILPEPRPNFYSRDPRSSTNGR